MTFIYDHTADPVAVTAYVNGYQGYALNVPQGNEEEPSDLHSDEWEGERILFQDRERLVAWAQAVLETAEAAPEWSA